MKVKNKYIKIKQGKNEVELHNLILDKYLEFYAYGLTNPVEKGLHACVINCTVQEEITEDMTEMNMDFYLEEQNRYNNNDFKGKNKIITQYLYELNNNQPLQSYIGKKIYSIGFGQYGTISEPDFKLYAVLDVSAYNLYVQDKQKFIVERVDEVTTDLTFSSETENFPIHLSPRGKTWFDEQQGIGTHETAKLNRVGLGYNALNPSIWVENPSIQYTNGTVYINGVNIAEVTTERLYPSNELYPSETLYPQKSQMNWIFYEFSVYKFIDTVTGYMPTEKKYYMAKNTNKTGNLDIQIKYERG